jgi:hypothetical protein
VAAGANLEATLQPRSGSEPLPAALARATPLALAAAEGKLDIMQVLLGEPHCYHSAFLLPMLVTGVTNSNLHCCKCHLFEAEQVVALTGLRNRGLLANALGCSAGIVFLNPAGPQHLHVNKPRPLPRSCCCCCSGQLLSLATTIAGYSWSILIKVHCCLL